MSSWEGEPDTHAGPASNGDDPGGAATPPADEPSVIAPEDEPSVIAPEDEPSVITPDAVITAPASTAWGHLPSDGRGVDPLPSTGSLVWAPDPTDATEPLPVVPSDPSVGTGPRPGSPDPTGELRSTAGPQAAPASPGRFTPPPSPAYARPPERPAHFARRRRHAATGGDAPRPPRTNRLAFGAAGLVLIMAVAALVLAVSDRDGSGDPGQPDSGSTPLAAGDATDPAGPIIGPTGVIGSWSGSEWLPRPDGEQPGAGLDYTILDLGESFETARGEATAEDCAAQRATSGTDVVVAIEQLSTDAEVYRQAAADVAAGLGATTPPTLTQLLRADLDGNGTNEIVVAAEHISDRAGLSPTAGDWSVVFLRRVVGDGAATEVLASSVADGGGSRLERIQVATLADLNRDGTMEVALAGRSPAGEWTSIHAIGDDGTPAEVLRAGCER